MLDWKEILIRLGLAALLGALIGLERERKNWTAGMRTHMMVCVGSSLIMIVSAYGFSDVLGKEHIVLDPARIAAQVISGIGFIGAGTILFLKQGTIRGLTTASGLWTVAGIGLATGGGMYFAAAATTVIALIILFAMQPLEKRLSRRFRPRILRIVTNNQVNATDIINDISRMSHISFTNFSFDKSDEGFIMEMKLEDTDQQKLAETIQELQANRAIKEFHLS